MSDGEMKLVRAIAAAMQSVETMTALKPAVVRILLEEIIRQRRVLEQQERKIERLEKKGKYGSLE